MKSQFTNINTQEDLSQLFAAPEVHSPFTRSPAGIPVISFVAWSGTGKTTYLEKLLRILTARGIKTATIKHDGHDFCADAPGSDSFRMTQAGARASGVFSKTHASLHFNFPMGSRELVSHITSVDLIIIEGDSTGPWSKVCLFRGDSGIKPVMGTPVALIGDKAPAGSSVPFFDIQKPESLANWLINRLSVPLQSEA